MSRTRSTPYHAQLDRLLNDAGGEHRCFSALTLSEYFEHPRQQRHTTMLGAIHKALSRAWSTGKLISFVDADGGVLREQDFGAPGSAAVEHPQIFATVGTPSPRQGYLPVTYQESSAFRPTADADDGTGDVPEMEGSDAAHEAADDSGEPVEPAGEPLTRERLAEVIGVDAADGLPDTLLAGLTLDALDAVVLVHRILTWTPKEPPPGWVPEEVLRRWVTLGRVVPHWRASLDQGSAAERARLVRLGVRRKGPIAADSLAARGLAQFVREDLRHWRAVAEFALAQYAAGGDLVPMEELPDLARDPVEYYLDGDVPGEVVLLTGLALGLDEAALQEIAADVADRSDVRAPSAEEQLRFQLSGRDAEISELRSQLREAQTDEKAARKEQKARVAELDRLRGADRRAGSADEELAGERIRAGDALARIAELEAKVDELSEDAARAKELDAEVRALEALRDELLAEAPSVERERGLREQAEAEVQTQLRRIRELTLALHEATEQRVEIPVEDGPALIAALAGPVAAAAQHAVARMAARTSMPGDAQLLRFAATFAALAEEMPATIAEPAPAPAGDSQVADAGGPPAPVMPAVAEPAAANGVAPEAAPGEPAVAGALGAETAAPESEAPPEQSEADRAEPVDDVTARPATAEVPPAERRPRRRAMPFTVRPIGGASEVGGSAILVQTRNGASVLLDAGQRVKGEFGAESVNQFHYGVPGTDGLDAILISHAHIDHIGSLPLIHEHHSELCDSPVPVVMTEPTKVLGEIMLNDSAKIQHARETTLSALAESDYGVGAMETAYSVPDVAACLDPAHVIVAEQHKPIPIEGTSLVARFLPVSHVLGSCAIHLKDTDTGATLLYSGDLGPISEPQLTLPDFGGTGMIDGADVILMESTYGLLRAEEREGRRRSSHGRERATKILADVASKTLDDGGHVLLPAFSLGRTQEIAMLIDRERGRSLPDGKIYVAGMGERITTVYDDFDRSQGGWRRSGEFPAITSVRKWLGGGNTFEDVVAEVLESRPSYIIASPAMISSGWSRAFLHAMVDDPRHAIVFTGYLPKHAGNIPNLREMHQGKSMRLDGENREIKCRWEKIGLSAHAPSSDLELFARDVTQGRDSAHIGLVHGMPEAQRDLAERLSGQLESATVRSLRNGEPWVPGRS